MKDQNSCRGGEVDPMGISELLQSGAEASPDFFTADSKVDLDCVPMSCWGENNDVAFSGHETDDWSEGTMSRLNGARWTDFRISVMNDDDGGNHGDDDDDGDFDCLSSNSPIGMETQESS